MKTKKKANLGSILRLLDFLWKNYKVSLIVSFILIILSSLATVNVTASIQSLVDVYVEPMLTSNSHDFGPLLSFLTAAFFLHRNFGFCQRGGQVLHGSVDLRFQQRLSETIHRIGVYWLAGGSRAIRTGDYLHDSF